MKLVLKSGILSFIYYWFCMVDSLLLSADESLRRGTLGQWIVRSPLLLMLAVDTMSLWNHGVFYITASGDYVRGRLYPVHFACCVLYYFAVLAVMIRSRRHRNYDRTVFHAVSMFTALPLLGGILQGILGSAPFTSVFFTFGMFLMFIILQTQQMNTDALTQLNNRRYFCRKLQQQVRDADGRKLCLAIIDIDYFKSINDNFSHNEGDRALKKVAHALRKTAAEAPQPTVIARYGGDEFVLMSRADSLEEFQKTGDLLNRNLELACAGEDTGYTLHCSFGAAILTEDMNAEQLMAMADHNLYEVKEKNHTAREKASRILR